MKKKYSLIDIPGKILPLFKFADSTQTTVYMYVSMYKTKS